LAVGGFVRLPDPPSPAAREGLADPGLEVGVVVAVNPLQGLDAHAGEARDRLRLRGPNGARDEFHLAATAQNLRKLAKLIPMPTPALA